MKAFLFSLTFFVISVSIYAQDNEKGTVLTREILAPSLQGNKGGEDPKRRLTIYLPPGYNESTQRYPCVYFLHGFQISDSVMYWGYFNHLMDEAIASKRIRPFILVLPNSITRFKGSFYTNSALGNWADFIAKDVVQYVDKNFRTIASKGSRGIGGHSMGGNGALKLSMLYPSIFGSVYALSPAVLDWAEEFNINSPSFKIADDAQSEEDLLKPLQLPLSDPNRFPGLMSALFTAVARAYSPNEQKRLFQVSFPVTYQEGRMEINTDVVKQWERNFPINLVEDNLPALKSLTALKIDWGRNDQFLHIPVTNRQFSKKLEVYGINHFAEEYIGNHTNHLGGKAGRINTELLPFFSYYLKFE